MQAVQAAIMLMSDENREVLQTLLCFLSDVTSSVEENQMTPMNIAVCLAPSLFHLNILKKDNLSPRYVLMCTSVLAGVCDFGLCMHSINLCIIINTFNSIKIDIVSLFIPQGCSRLLSLCVSFKDIRLFLKLSVLWDHAVYKQSKAL